MILRAFFLGQDLLDLYKTIGHGTFCGEDFIAICIFSMCGGYSQEDVRLT